MTEDSGDWRPWYPLPQRSSGVVLISSSVLCDVHSRANASSALLLASNKSTLLLSSSFFFLTLVELVQRFFVFSRVIQAFVGTTSSANYVYGLTVSQSWVKTCKNIVTHNSRPDFHWLYAEFAKTSSLWKCWSLKCNMSDISLDFEDRLIDWLMATHRSRWAQHCLCWRCLCR